MSIHFRTIKKVTLYISLMLTFLGRRWWRLAKAELAAGVIDGCAEAHEAGIHWIPELDMSGGGYWRVGRGRAIWTVNDFGDFLDIFRCCVGLFATIAAVAIVIGILAAANGQIVAALDFGCIS